MVIDRDNRIGAERATAGPDNRSLGELIKDLRDETVELMRQELVLAKTELSDKAAAAGKHASALAVGGVVALLGAIFMLLALSQGLYSLMVTTGVNAGKAIWIAPLIVGLLVAGAGYVLIQKGINALKCMSAAPDKTIESLKENKQWLEEKIS